MRLFGWLRKNHPALSRRDLMRAHYPEHYDRIMRYAEAFWACYPRWLDLVPEYVDERRGAAETLKGLFPFDLTTEGFDYWMKVYDPEWVKPPPLAPELQARVDAIKDTMLLTFDAIDGVLHRTRPEAQL